MNTNINNLFIEYCKILEEISASSDYKKKYSLISELFEKYKLDNNEDSNNNCFPILRLILPDLDRTRGPYNLKESSFSKTIINMLCLDPKGNDAMQLKQYKQSTKHSNYAIVAASILRKRYNQCSNLTINDINEYLDIISSKAGKDIRGQEETILNVFRASSELEQKWFIKIVLKDLKLGVGHKAILNIFHPDASRFIDTHNNLQQVCTKLIDRSVRLNEIEVELFEVFNPMLSTRCDSKEFSKNIQNGNSFYIENKFDGERFQMHYANGNIKYFSRRGFNYTQQYQANGYTAKLIRCIKDSVENCILDGEMMIWNEETKKFGSKGMEVDIKKVKADNIHKPCFCAFDIIYLNNTVITNKPLKERKLLLQKIFTSVEGVIVLSDYYEIKTQQEVLDALNASMDRKEEGIIIKDPNSVYLPNERIGWWKMKLEGVMTDIDVVIIGGYYLPGSLKQKISDYLVGIFDKDTKKYLSFAKMSTGLNQKELEILNKRLEPHWHNVELSSHEDFNISWGKQVPDVWIKPESSCCLLVRGSELTRVSGSKPDYRSAYTLRFPRIIKIRFDKPPFDCLTTEELDKLTFSSNIVEKLNKRYLELSDILQQSTTIKKVRKRKHVYEEVPLENKSKILSGYEILVLTGKGEWSKESVELAVRENGGEIVHVENSNTLCILCGDEHLRVKTYKGECDIVNVAWLRRTLNEGEFSLFEPDDMIHTSDKTKIRFMKTYDKFGDTYTKNATVDSIKKIISKMLNDDINKHNYVNLQMHEIIQLKKEMGFEGNLLKFE